MYMAALFVKAKTETTKTHKQEVGKFWNIHTWIDPLDYGSHCRYEQNSLSLEKTNL